MEDYEYEVMKLHATLFQNSSQCTGNVSKNTGKFTSKTNQIRLGGATGGPTPSSRASPRLYSPPQRGVALDPGWPWEVYETIMRL